MISLLVFVCLVCFIGMALCFSDTRLEVVTQYKRYRQRYFVARQERSSNKKRKEDSAAHVRRLKEEAEERKEKERILREKRAAYQMQYDEMAAWERNLAERTGLRLRFRHIYDEGLIDGSTFNALWAPTSDYELYARSLAQFKEAEKVYNTIERVAVPKSGEGRIKELTAQIKNKFAVDDATKKKLALAEERWAKSERDCLVDDYGPIVCTDSNTQWAKNHPIDAELTLIIKRNEILERLGGFRNDKERREQLDFTEQVNTVIQRFSEGKLGYETASRYIDNVAMNFGYR